MDKVSTYLRALNVKTPNRLHINFRNSLIHYDIVGSGKLMILLHGFLEDSRMWDGLSSELVKDHAVLTIDLIGHGKSDCINYVHSMDDMAEAVHSVVKAENFEKPVMIGHSMGGYVALAYAEKYGENLSGLGLFHSTGNADTDQKKIDRERSASVAMEHSDLYAEITIPKLFIEGRIEEMKTEIDACVEVAKSHPGRGVVANIRGMKERPDRSGVFRNFSGPKLFVHGVKDPVLDLENAKEQCKDVDSLTAVFLEDVGHMGHLEAPEKMAGIFKEFMKKCAYG